MSDDSLKDNERAGVVDEDYENEIVSRFGEALFPLIKRFGYEGIDSIGILIARLRQGDRQAALYLMEISPSLIERLLPYGEDLVLNIYDLANQMIPFGPLLTVRFLEMSPRIIEKDGLENLVNTTALIHKVAEVHAATAINLVEKSPDLLEAVGFDGLEKITGFIAAIAGSSWNYALKAIENSFSVINRLNEQGGKPLVLVVYDLGRRMAADDWNCALEFVGKSTLIAENLLTLGHGAQLIDLYKQAGRLTPFNAQLTLSLLEAAPRLIDRLGLSGFGSIRRCAMAIAADHREKAVTLIKESPDLVDNLISHIPPDQAVEIYELGRELAGLGSGMALIFISGSVKLVDRPHHPNLKCLVDTAKEIAATSRTASEAFLTAGPALIGKVDREGLRKVVELIIPIARENWETASKLFLKSPY